MCWSVWLVVSRDSRGEARDRGEGERLLFVKGWWQILTVPFVGQVFALAWAKCANACDLAKHVQIVIRY